MEMLKKIRLKILHRFYKFGAMQIFFILIVNTLTNAQVNNSKDSVKIISSVDSNKIATFNLPKIDSIKLAKSDLKGEVKYKAIDSIVYDAEQKIFLLYNKGNILYDDLELNADFIHYNVDSSTLSANPTDTAITDSTEKPLFKQGDQLFTFSQLQYNFKSQRALVEGAKTQYNDGYIISTQVKRNADKSIYGLTNIYTTCSLDTPHFGIYAKKIKIIPDMVGISGPARLVIEDIPTPVILPFGIFPLKKGQHAGFILPQYGFEQARGFGLRNFGYYFPINEYMDAKVLGDIFSFGSYRAAITTRYLKRYNYNGSLSLSYSKNITERSEDVFFNENKTFNIQWSHTIDPKKLKGASFSANVNIGSSNSNQFNFNNSIDALLNNTMNSNINYSKTWLGKPYNLTVSASHNQNNTTRRYDITLPTIQFSASGLTPFARKNIVGKPKWYDKISVNYTSRILNSLFFYDTAFNTTNIVKNNMNNGMEQGLSSAYNTTILKYFNWNVSSSYNEYWYTKKRLRYYNAQEYNVDTIVNNGFYTARSYTASTSITTNIYGLKTFKKGWIRGIRHHASPSASLNYTPDFGSPFYNYYYETYLDSFYRTQKLFYYEGAPIGSPTKGKNGSINFSLNNNLQAKFHSNKDTANDGVKKVAILDNFTLNTAYNLMADSNNWSPLNMSYSTNILNKIRISGGGSFDYYAIDTLGRRTKYFEYKQNNKLLRLQNAGINISTQYASKKKSAKDKATDEQKKAIGNQFQNYMDFNVPWTIDIRLNFGVVNSFSRNTKKDTLVFTGDINFGGDVNLTENWKINYRSGYNFSTKQITGSEIGLSRNLHCWEMSFNIIPFGYGRSYVFSLRPKSSMLHDLNVTRRRSFFDN